MKNKIFIISLIVFFIFIFVIFYKGLNNSSIYTPEIEIKKSIPVFTAKTLNKKILIQSKNIFDKNKFYIFNVWASWCVPCIDEHPLLMKLNSNEKIKIIGLNYKDNTNNAKKFLEKLGNPYSIILVDRDGTKAIEWGSFGVPETFLIYQNQIIKKYIGPLNEEAVIEIEALIK